MINLERIISNLDVYAPLPPDRNHIVQLIRGKVCFDGWCPLPIKTCGYFTKTDIDVINGSGAKIGKILFLKDQNVEVISLPLEKCICLLCEYPDDTIAERFYVYKKDYLLIAEESLEAYLDRSSKSSSLWGGFFHEEDLPNNTFSRSKLITQITSCENITISRPFYFDNLELVLNETNPFNRFLKLYHLLELNFDMHTAEKIKSLLDAGHKELDISRTLKDYNREDIERLKSLLINKIIVTKLAPFLDEITNFRTIATQLFYDHGKDSNPLKQKSHFDDILRNGGFNEANINKIIGHNRFSDLIPKLTAYWIYRIRSSIAHNKLGEYLMTVHDEEFIIEFAEPLIRECLIHTYSN